MNNLSCYIHNWISKAQITFNRLYKPDDKWNVNLKQSNYFMWQFCVTISEVIYRLYTLFSSAWNGIKIITTISLRVFMCSLLRWNITIIVTLKRGILWSYHQLYVWSCYQNIIIFHFWIKSVFYMAGYYISSVKEEIDK